MRKGLFLVTILVMANVLAAQVRRGNVIVPKSSIAQPGDLGVRAHTDYVFYAPGGIIPNSSSPTGETPASLGCVYGLVSSPLSGCPIATSTSNPTGGSHIIAIVDAYHYPTAAADLNTFSTTFGLPAAHFHQVRLNNAPTNCGWEVEESLDIEWAHAMAPNAIILLVEAKSNSTTDLFAAVDMANSLIAAHGGKGEVTMSWGYGSDFSGETTLDSHFTTPGVVYFASSGDAGGVAQYPSTSPNLVSAGGTTVLRSGSSFTGEKAWSGSGGGDSTIELRPSYQNGISSIVGSFRGTPDFSYDADPASGVSVYNTSTASCGAFQWFVVGGTSVSSPALAGVVNSTGTFNTSSNAENTEIYSNLGNSSIFTDITSGSCGSHSSVGGWDFCTGVGTDVGKSGK